MAIDPGRVKALFQAAIGRVDSADRRAFLDGETGDDAELRARLDALLAAHDRPQSVLDRPLDGDPRATFPDPGASGESSPQEPGRIDAGDATESQAVEEGTTPLGTLIAGRYKLRQEIGEGGMGTVYLAEQTQPVRRRVALKLVKPGMDTRNVLARFESERQALALMDHPHIARVLDAGSTEQGRPFFVMELVKGVPLTEYCDQHRLDLPERLAIFRQICSAVQHAHQKGIIHRDLKPTNILVESHDGKPVPKVIDFGLAKAASGLRLSEHSLFTAFGSVTGTPRYMAPEQATFNALDVDTRADIYALGVILYELLTGSTPITRDTVQRAALDEMLRVIREVEPQTPSSRISTSERLPSLAASRHVEPGRLSRLVRGELDWIVMKALAKERDRRYDSAIGLANDVERYLNHEPVTAGPPTAAYRMRKFVRRHRGEVAAAALVFLVLVCGVVGTTLGLLEARRQEGRARDQEQIAIAESAEKEKALQAEAAQRLQAEKRLTQVAKMNDILGSIFTDLNPENAARDGKPLSAVLGERLDRATAAIEGEATGDPLAVAKMQMTLGDSQRALGYPKKAIVLFTKARATYAARLGPDHPYTLASMNNLARSYRDAGQIDRAFMLHEETLALMKAKLGADHPYTLQSMGNLAISFGDAGQTDRAIKLEEETLALMKAKLGPDHPNTLQSMSNLAISYHARGQIDRAIKLHEETLALMKPKLGPGHPETLNSMTYLAISYHAAGQIDRAIKLHEETLALLKAKLGPDHPETLNSMTHLAASYCDAGRIDRAIKLHEETLALLKVKLGPDHPYTRASMSSLEFARNLRTAPDRYRAELARNGPGHIDTHLAHRDLAQLYMVTNRLDEAEQILVEFIESGVGSEEIIDFTIKLLRDCMRQRQRDMPDSWLTFHTTSQLGRALVGRQKYDEAGPLLRTGYEGMKHRADKIPTQDKIRLAEALDGLIRLAEATNKPDAAQAWRDEKAQCLAESAPKPEAEPK